VASVTAEEIELVQLSTIRRCPENDDIYSGQSIDDPDIRA
jgi:hypothetical protein